MGRMSVSGQFDIASLPDKEVAQKLRPLIDDYNQFKDETVRNVNGNLTLVSNVKGSIRQIRMKHNEETKLDFLGTAKTTKVLVLDVSDNDAVTSLRRKIDSKNQLVLKPSFADASTEFRDVTLFLIP